MNLIARVFAFLASFVFGAFAGTLFSTASVQEPYPQIQVIDSSLQQKTERCPHRRDHHRGQ